jgi:hypothetical protein
VRDWLEQLESAEPGEEELQAMLAFVAGQDVRLDDDERAAATRRALLVLAAGGDPHRELTLGDRAVQTLADDTFTFERSMELARGLAALRDAAARLPRVWRELGHLLAEPELAWRAYAAALLADELTGDEER